MRSRSDLFDEQQVDAIFGNLEALFEFQKKFLVDLELCLNWNSLEDSVIGDCFIQSVIKTNCSYLIVKSRIG